MFRGTELVSIPVVGPATISMLPRLDAALDSRVSFFPIPNSGFCPFAWTHVDTVLHDHKVTDPVRHKKDEDHIRAVLAFIRPYKNVIDYELLPYHRFGESKYAFLGQVYELADFQPSPETLTRLRGIIDDAFGRTGKTT